MLRERRTNILKISSTMIPDCMPFRNGWNTTSSPSPLGAAAGGGAADRSPNHSTTRPRDHTNHDGLVVQACDTPTPAATRLAPTSPCTVAFPVVGQDIPGAYWQGLSSAQGARPSPLPWPCKPCMKRCPFMRARHGEAHPSPASLATVASWAFTKGTRQHP